MIKIIKKVDFKLYLGDDGNKYSSKHDYTKIINNEGLPIYGIIEGEVNLIDYSVEIIDIKELNINKVKNKASEILSNLDWKCIRHRDQVDNSETTSLTAGEYQTLLNYRKSIREWSNDKEVEINEAADLNELESIDILDYPNA